MAEIRVKFNSELVVHINAHDVATLQERAREQCIPMEELVREYVHNLFIEEVRRSDYDIYWVYVGEV